MNRVVIAFPSRPMPPGVRAQVENLLRLQGHPKVAAEVSGKLADYVQHLRTMNYIIPDEWKGQ